MVKMYAELQRNKNLQNIRIKSLIGNTTDNPITTAIYEYPTFVQTVDYPEFSINAKDGSSFTVDPTISLKIVDGKSGEVFKKYRKEDITEVINTTLYNYVKNAFRIQLNNYTIQHNFISLIPKSQSESSEKPPNPLKKQKFVLHFYFNGDILDVFV